MREKPRVVYLTGSGLRAGPRAATYVYGTPVGDYTYRAVLTPLEDGDPAPGEKGWMRGRGPSEVEIAGAPLESTSGVLIPTNRGLLFADDLTRKPAKKTYRLPCEVEAVDIEDALAQIRERLEGVE